MTINLNREVHHIGVTPVYNSVYFTTSTYIKSNKLLFSRSLTTFVKNFTDEKATSIPYRTNDMGL